METGQKGNYMKTNLDKIYKNDASLEKEGIWFDVAKDCGFLIKRFGGFNSQAVKMELAKYYKPFAKQIENGTMDERKERELSLKVFVNSCILDWKGIEIDGAIAPFSKEACINVLLELPELTDTLIQYASDSKNYREEVGNSLKGL